MIQPDSANRTIARYSVSADGKRLEHPQALIEATHTALDQPTTGVIVDNALYVVANSQLQRFRKLYAETKGVVPLTALKAPIVLRLPLRSNNQE